MNKAQQLRIATALAGVTVPPKGAAMVRQQDQGQRVDRKGSNIDKPQRFDRKTANKRLAACSVHTVSGGGASAPADNGKGSLRNTISNAMGR